MKLRHLLSENFVLGPLGFRDHPGFMQPVIEFELEPLSGVDYALRAVLYHRAPGAMAARHPHISHTLFIYSIPMGFGGRPVEPTITTWEEFAEHMKHGPGFALKSFEYCPDAEEIRRLVQAVGYKIRQQLR